MGTEVDSRKDDIGEGWGRKQKESKSLFKRDGGGDLE